MQLNIDKKVLLQYLLGEGCMQIVRRRQNRIEINLLGVLQVFWKKKIGISLMSCMFGLAALGIGLFGITPKYTSYITLYANNSNSVDKTTSITSNDILASVQLVDTYSAIILTDNVLDTVIDELNLSVETEELLDNIRIESVNETEVFKVFVEDSSPERAAEIANKISEIAPQQIESIVEGCSIKLVNAAKIPTKRSSPNYMKILAIGVLVGFLFSSLFLILKEMSDTRIKSEEDLATFGFPILSNVPDFAEADKMMTYGYERGK